MLLAEVTAAYDTLKSSMSRTMIENCKRLSHIFREIRGIDKTHQTAELITDVEK